MSGVTFGVSDVRRATGQLPEVPYLDAVNDHLGAALRSRRKDLRDELRYLEADKDEVRVGSSRVDLQACKLEYSIVSPK